MAAASSRSLRGIALLLVIGCLALGVLVARVYVRGEHAMNASDRAFHRGDVGTALVRAREAALWYLPLAPHQKRAYDRLRAIAIGAEARGDVKNARRAWAAIRGALLETSHPLVSTQAKLHEANRQVVRVMLAEKSEIKVIGDEATRRSAEAAELGAHFERGLGARPLLALFSGAGALLLLLLGLRSWRRISASAVDSALVVLGLTCNWLALGQISLI